MWNKKDIYGNDVLYKGHKIDIRYIGYSKIRFRWGMIGVNLFIRDNFMELSVGTENGKIGKITMTDTIYTEHDLYDAVIKVLYSCGYNDGDIKKLV